MIGSKTDPDYLNGVGEVGLVKPKEFCDDEPFQFERGGEIASSIYIMKHMEILLRTRKMRFLYAML